MVSAPPTFAAPDTTPASGASTLRASALYNWHLAPSLAALRTEVNARWPSRDRSSDGAIGDTRHQSRSGSHNPARYPGGPGVGTLGSVHALDITARGIDVGVLISSVVGDPRVWYVIHNGQIWSRSTGWAPRAHGGDPHSLHIHINLREDSHAVAVASEQNTARWLRRSASQASWARPAHSAAPAAALTTPATRALQRALIARGFGIPSGPTGRYGVETTRAVAAFQRSQGWGGAAADGRAGQLTLRRLGVSTAGATPSATVARTSAGTSTRASKGWGTYRPGTAHRSVYFLQQALAKRGYRIPTGPNGYYGTSTVRAVRAFQLAQGWPAAQCDGVPGPRTLRLLGLG